MKKKKVFLEGLRAEVESAAEREGKRGADSSVDRLIVGCVWRFSRDGVRGEMSHSHSGGVCVCVCDAVGRAQRLKCTLFISPSAPLLLPLNPEISEKHCYISLCVFVFVCVCLCASIRGETLGPGSAVRSGTVCRSF